MRESASRPRVQETCNEQGIATRLRQVSPRASAVVPWQPSTASLISTRTARSTGARFWIPREYRSITTAARRASSSSRRHLIISHSRISSSSSTTTITCWSILTTRSRVPVPMPPGCAACFPPSNPCACLITAEVTASSRNHSAPRVFHTPRATIRLSTATRVRPADRFDCIVSFEVLEHATDPRHVFADMNELLAASGIIVCSTLLQPADIDRQGLSWWYAGPRNGHVSLHSRTSLETVIRPFGFRLGSFNDCFHVLYRTVPEFARHFITS